MFESCNANRFGACHSSSVVVFSATDSSSVEFIEEFNLVDNDSVLAVIDRLLSSVRERFLFCKKPKNRHNRTENKYSCNESLEIQEIG